MNIFYVASNPEVAANLLCDQHVLKMLLESCQLLSYVHHHFAVIDRDGGHHDICPPSKQWCNHPCAKWARASVANYLWLARHAVALSNEYELRFGKYHAWRERSRWLLANLPKTMTSNDFNCDYTPPPQCVDPSCYQEDTVQAYLDYYRRFKLPWARYTRRPGGVPEIFRQEVVNAPNPC